MNWSVQFMQSRTPALLICVISVSYLQEFTLSDSNCQELSAPPQSNIPLLASVSGAEFFPRLPSITTTADIFAF